MQRGDVDIVATSDGQELTYSVTDKEKPLDYGSKCPAIRITGNATFGWECELKKAVDTAITSFVQSTFQVNVLNMGLNSVLGAINGTGAAFTVGMIPRFQANAVVRCWGDKNASKADLAQLALSVAIDRFTVANRSFFNICLPVSAYLTQDVEQRFFDQVFQSGFDMTTLVTSGKLMNMNTVVHTNKDDLTGNVQAPRENPPLPNSKNTRGYIAARMVAQVLQDPGNLPPTPAKPPQNPKANDPLNFKDTKLQ